MKPQIYIYVVDRDFGFAPNPFHGFCTLATCKPGIRKTARVNDWVFGVGGANLNATGRCIFAMKVTKTVSYNEYWNLSEYRDKKPVRNGSKKMIVGDNIYFKNEEGEWCQAHSHHSLPDGTINIYNVNNDTRSQNVLISNHFIYFGALAPSIPQEILDRIGYRNKRGYRVFEFIVAKDIVRWLETKYSKSFNLVLADPFSFDNSQAHYSVKTNRVVGIKV